MMWLPSSLDVFAGVISKSGTCVLLSVAPQLQEHLCNAQSGLDDDDTHQPRHLT